MLGGFLAVEKTKNYSKTASIFLVGLGGICVVRMFIFPLIIMNNYGKFVEAYNNGADTSPYKKWIGSTITGYYESGSAARWLDHSGYFRGVAAMILLAAAAALLIFAGVIGFIRSKKLTNYLNSLNQEK